MRDDDNINLLILEASSNDAETLNSILRNAGHLVHSEWIDNHEGLEEYLQHKTPDLVLCADDIEDLSPGQVINILHQQGIAVPVVVVTDVLDEEKTVEALKTGARDLVAKSSPEHMQQVVAREMEYMRTLMALEQYRRNYQEVERRCHSLLDKACEAIAYVHEGMHVYANPAYLKTFGYNDFEDIECVTLMDLVAQEDRDRFKRFVRDYNKNMEAGGQIEVKLQPENGDVLEATVELSPAVIDGEPCTQVIIRTLVIDQELQDKVKYLSKQDIVTGLYNRQYFLKELETSVEQINAREAQPGGLLYILIDKFKQIRDQAGLAGTDRVVAEVADILRAHCSDDGMLLARFGDSSFALLALDKTREELIELAMELQQAIDSHVSEVSGKHINTRCCIGISLIGATSESADDILNHADLACDIARNSKQDHIHLHNPETDQAAGKERDEFWTRQINLALKEHRFRLVYQPIVSLHGESRELYEVLIRLVDEHGDEVSPGKFMPGAERAGLTAELDRWVIKRATGILAEQQAKGHKTQFFIKLSAASIKQQKATLKWIQDCLREHRVDEQSLTFEVAENAAFAHMTLVKPMLENLHKLKCSTAVEHFGKHPRADNLLKLLPIDIIKIDGSFIHHLASDQNKQARVRQMTEQAKSRGKQTIAEFVEDANSLSVLWQCGVNYIQGYFLQAPDEALAYDFGAS